MVEKRLAVREHDPGMRKQSERLQNHSEAWDVHENSELSHGGVNSSSLVLAGLSHCQCFLGDFV